MKVLMSLTHPNDVVAGDEQRSGASAAAQQPSAFQASGAPQAEVTGPSASALSPAAASAPPTSLNAQVCILPGISSSLELVALSPPPPPPPCLSPSAPSPPSPYTLSSQRLVIHKLDSVLKAKTCCRSLKKAAASYGRQSYHPALFISSFATLQMCRTSSLANNC